MAKDVEDLKRQLRDHPERKGLAEVEIDSIASSISKYPHGSSGALPLEILNAMSPDEEFCARRRIAPAALVALGAETTADRQVRIPMRDGNGRTVGHRLRAANNGAVHDGKKSYTPYGEKTGLMGTWPLLPDGPLWIVEGEMDALALCSHGAAAVIATPGSKPKDSILRDLGALAKGREAILLPHGDAAGRSWLERVGATLSFVALSVRYYQMPAGKDADDVLRAAPLPMPDMWPAKCRILESFIEASEPFTPLPPVDKNRLTETANAERIAEDHFGRMLYSHEIGLWLVWDGTVWRPDHDSLTVTKWAKSTAARWYDELPKIDDPQIKDAVVRHAKASLSAKGIKSALELARSIPGMSTKLAEFDSLPHEIAVANGVIDLRTSELRPHSPSNRIMRIIPVEYDPCAECPRFRRFLHEIFDGDQSLVDFIVSAFGYTLTGETREHVVFVLHGAGSNGKSVLAEVSKALFGDYYCKSDSSLLIDTGKPRNAGDASPHIVALHGKRFVVASETAENRRFDEAQLKELTGGDTITARDLYSRLITFAPSHKLWLLTNHPPHVSNDVAIWRRLRLIPFNVQFVDSPAPGAVRTYMKDPELADKLKATELPGILRLFVEAAREWYVHGLQEPEAVKSATRGYREEVDVIGRFISECCEIGEGLKCSGTALHQAFEVWARDSGEPCMKQAGFGRQLGQRGYGKQGSRPVFRLGIALKAAPAAQTVDDLGFEAGGNSNVFNLS